MTFRARNDKARLSVSGGWHGVTVNMAKHGTGEDAVVMLDVDKAKELRALLDDWIDRR